MDQQIFVVLDSSQVKAESSLTIHFCSHLPDSAINLKGIYALVNTLSAEELGLFEEDLQAVIDAWLEKKGLQRKP